CGHHRVADRKADNAVANRGYHAAAFSPERFRIVPHGERIHDIAKIESARRDTDFNLPSTRLAPLQSSKPHVAENTIRIRLKLHVCAIWWRGDPGKSACHAAFAAHGDLLLSAVRKQVGKQSL